MKNQSTFVFRHTADGSPTLSLGEKGEWMHHRQGALSETLYVYGEAIDALFLTGGEPSFVSVGLGLGYVERLIAAKAIVHNKTETTVIRSFESESILREQVDHWLGSFEGPRSAYGLSYDSISAGIGDACNVSPSQIETTLKNWRETGQWTIEGELTPESPWPRTFACLLFDAYSCDTSPELWTRRFLDCFLANAAAPRCIFASYAATGDLKRSLKRAGFSTGVRPGFSGKRECTLSIRT